MSDPTSPRAHSQATFDARHRRALLRMRTSSSFFIVYHDFIRFLDLSIEEAAVLGDMINTAGMRDYEPADGWFDYTVEWMYSRTHIQTKAQQRVINVLKEKGWIETRKDGHPARRKVRINAEAIENAIDEGLNKPSQIENDLSSKVENDLTSKVEIDLTSNKESKKDPQTPKGGRGGGLIKEKDRLANNTMSLRFARRLRDILQAKLKKSIPYTETNWARQFDLLRASLNGDESRVQEILDWYEKDWDRIKVKAYSAKTFKDKFTKFLEVKDMLANNPRGAPDRSEPTAKGSDRCSNKYQSIPDDVREQLEDMPWKGGAPVHVEGFYTETLAAAGMLLGINSQLDTDTEEGVALDNFLYALGGTAKQIAIEWCRTAAISSAKWRDWSGSLKPFRLHPDSWLFSDRLKETCGRVRSGTITRLLTHLRREWS